LTDTDTDAEERVIYVGIDWAEDHHDSCILDEAGRQLAAFRIDEGLEGVRKLHGRLAEHAEEPEDIVIGLETDRGLLVDALVAGGYQLYAINPLAASRYRDRHSISGAKSDRGDAKVLADVVRTDRHNHRPVAADSSLAQALKVLTRSHQNLIWTRQRQLNQLRNALREYYPAALAVFGTDLAHSDALAVLAKAPTPEQGRRLSIAQIRSALKRGGRQRNLDRRASEIRDALRAEQLHAPPLVTDAFGTTTAALVGVITTLNDQVAELEASLVERFEQHPDAELILSLPGLGHVLGARVLAEFGDAPNRYQSAKARRNYAGTSPVTIASGTSRAVVARFKRNKRLIDACWQWSLTAMNNSPGARAYYNAHNPGPHTSRTARRKLANKLVGILHGCLQHDHPYDETLAFAHWQPTDLTDAA
jgi:transposase